MKRVVFSDLIDVDNLKKMVKANYDASGIPVGIHDAYSGEVYAIEGWQRICADFHRKNEALRKRCVESDTQIASKMKRGEPFAYKCKNGLWDIGIPVFCLEQHIATVFLGQFFYEGEVPDRNFFISQAEQYGLDVNLYLEALDEVRVFSKQQVDAILEYNKAFAEFLSNIVSKSELLRQKSEEKYKALVDKMPALLYTFSTEKGGIYVYGKAEEILGYAPSYLMKNPFLWQNSIHSDDIEKVKAAISNFQAGQDFEIEYRIRDRQGSWHWFYDRSIGREKDASGDIIEGLAIDITDRKRAEEQQRIQSQIMNQVHDSVIAVDLDGMITSWNKGSEILFNYSENEAIGKHISMLYPDYSHSSLRDDIIPTLLKQGSHGYEATLLRKGGEAFTANVSLSVLKDDAGKVVGMVGYSLDISEQKRIQRALADSEKRFANIIDFLPDPTWVIDNEGRIIAWNHAVERLTGIKKNEIMGQGDYAYAVPFYGKRRPILIDLVLKRDEEWEKMYLSIKERDGILIESESFHPHMGEGGLYFAATAAKLYNAEGDVVGAIETLRDITATKCSEKEREEIIAELQDAISKVRTLSGLLPICASCKKIRDDAGYWNQVEKYIGERSEAKFSHSLCPDCTKKLYPEFDLDDVHKNPG